VALNQADLDYDDPEGEKRCRENLWGTVERVDGAGGWVKRE
jgi:hypothetical protein